MDKVLSALYGLKWNPFSPDIPTEGLRATPSFERFARRIESLSREGGFGVISGPPGAGKSAALRLLIERLSSARDLRVGELTRPQASLHDFYRELGALFGVPLSPSNRWAGAKGLRERWSEHIDSSLFRPLLIVDEAQEMLPGVLSELRLLSSADLDSRRLLTVVLAGDGRLLEKLKDESLQPLASRIRTRCALDAVAASELVEVLRHVLSQAGNPKLMTPELMVTVAEHAGGNLRTMMILADELLAAGVERELAQLDEKLYLEMCAPPASLDRAPKRRSAAARAR